MEIQARRALIASGGDPGVFVERPLTVGLLAAAVLALAVPYVPAQVARLRGRPTGVARLAFGDED